VEGDTVAAIGRGLVVLLGVAGGDTPEDAEKLARKTADLRIFLTKAAADRSCWTSAARPWW
jgi:D-Tyr-tRNAtyr deacylase